ncbi:hypothetical protein MSAN_00555300 [Mycena sanguinolenta]|uniref:Uncharacterized protein n=1 Tax=Mycena sanguinolenta TaxID=230812 RepID=A0A8H6ZAQ9_9AGAR|nr:hypothetical protein MSAN_00555300 [Mycena sanguinolenta]
MAKRCRDEDEDEYVPTDEDVDHDEDEEEEEEEEPKRRVEKRANIATRKPGKRTDSPMRDGDEDESEDEENEDEEAEELPKKQYAFRRSITKTQSKEAETYAHDEEDDEDAEEHEHDEEEDKEEDEEQHPWPRKQGPSAVKNKGNQPDAHRRAQDDEDEEEDNQDTPPPPKRRKLNTGASGNKSASKKPEERLDTRPLYQKKSADDRKKKRATPSHKEALEAKRLATAVEWHEPTAEFLLENTCELLLQRSKFQQLLDECPRNATENEIRRTLRSIFDLACEFDHVVRASPSHGFWLVFNRLTFPTLRFLIALAHGLTLSDIDAAVAAGVLEHSAPNDLTPCPYAAANYLLANPGDAPYAVLRLAELGATRDVTEKLLHEAFDPLGHKPTIDRCVKELGEEYSLTAVPDPQITTYAGTSADTQPVYRHLHDHKRARDGKLPTHLGGWIVVNDAHTEWKCYRIRELCLPKSSGVRTDPVAAMCEQFTVAIQLGRDLNSAVGGWFRLFDPPPEIAAILAKIPTPIYGSSITSACRQGSDIVRAYYGAERNHVGSRICDDSYATAVKNVADATRSNGDTIPFLRIMKDLTEEALTGPRSFWEADAGKGPQLYRHLLRLLNPHIPEAGDLPEAVIASDVGPTIDLYRLVAGTRHFWVHALGTSTLLVALKPIIVSTNSNAVFTTVAEGYLRLVWQGIPESVADEILSGQLPSNVAQYLPSAHDDPFWHPVSTDGVFLENIGGLIIGRYGADDHNLAIIIPNLHPGVSKYRARESILVETIITLVCAIESVALAHVQERHDRGVFVPRHDATSLRSYLIDLRTGIEADLVQKGLRVELDKVKSEYRRLAEVPRHLEKMLFPIRKRRSPLSRADPYEIPGITRASAPGAPRLEQYAFIKSYLEDLFETGLVQRAHNIIPSHFRTNFQFDEFRKWLLNLREGVRISCSARVWGNSPEARANQLRSHEAFAKNTAAHSAGGQATAAKWKERDEFYAIPSNRLRKIIEDTADLIKTPPPKRRTGGSLALADTHRWCFCETCEELLIASKEDYKHSCQGAPAVYFREGMFPTQQSIVYPHDILANPDLAPLVSHSADLVTEIDVQTIFKSPKNRKIALEVIPDLDFSELQGSIWAAKDNENMKDKTITTLHVAMALDRCAESLSQCPAHLLPKTAGDKAKAWAYDSDKWLGGSKPIFVMRCEFGHFEAMEKYKGRYFDHPCAGTEARRPVDPKTNRRIPGTCAKGGDRDCGTQQSHEVRSIRDLPPEHIRRVIYTKLVVDLQPERIIKRRKPRNNKTKTGAV